MFGPNSPGTAVVLAGSILLLLSTLSTPLIKPIYFLSVDLTHKLGSSNIQIDGNLKFGVFGFCAQVGSQVNCTKPRFGYDLESDSIAFLPSSFNLTASTSPWIIRAFTYILILHPIAAVLAFLSVILGLISHLREFAKSCFTSCVSSLASALGLLAFAFDMLAFTIARHRINNFSTSETTVHAKLGNAIWITLGGWLCLAISGCFFCAGRCIFARRRRQQIHADFLRPKPDKQVNDYMRSEAHEAEKAREKVNNHPVQDDSHLPSFSEYTTPFVDQEHIPLVHFQSNNADYNRDDAERVHDRGHSYDQSITGVGVGYGTRQPSTLAPMPPPANNYSQQQAYTHESHNGHLLPIPSLPPISIHNNNHNNTDPANIYNNLPAHVTPASHNMNDNSSQLGSPTGSTHRHRHPLSLTPAGRMRQGSGSELGQVLRGSTFGSQPSSIPTTRMGASPPSSQYIDQQHLRYPSYDRVARQASSSIDSSQALMKSPVENYLGSQADPQFSFDSTYRGTNYYHSSTGARDPSVEFFQQAALQDSPHAQSVSTLNRFDYKDRGQSRRSLSETGGPRDPQFIDHQVGNQPQNYSRTAVVSYGPQQAILTNYMTESPQAEMAEDELYGGLESDSMAASNAPNSMGRFNATDSMATSNATDSMATSNATNSVATSNLQSSDQMTLKEEDHWTVSERDMTRLHTSNTPILSPPVPPNNQSVLEDSSEHVASSGDGNAPPPMYR